MYLSKRITINSCFYLSESHTKMADQTGSFTLTIGGKYAGQFTSLNACIRYARSHAGYWQSWSVWDNFTMREVPIPAESAIDYTSRIHGEFYDGMGEAANFIITCISGLVVIAVIAQMLGF